MIRAKQAEDMGRDDFLAGKPRDANPFMHTSARNGGIALTAWWDTGWIKASKAAEEGRRLKEMERHP